MIIEPLSMASRMERSEKIIERVTGIGPASRAWEARPPYPSEIQ